MKKLLILATLLAAPLAIYAEKNDSSKTAVQNIGKGGAGTQIINAIADVRTFDIPQDKFTSLGVITEDKLVDIVIPKEPDTQTAYFFIPTAGESKDKVIEVIFANIKQLPGERLYGKSVVKVFRRFSTDPKNRRTEIGTITYSGMLNQLDDEQLKEQIKLKKDGTTVYLKRGATPGEKAQPMIFLAGTKDLSAARALEEAQEAAEAKLAV